MRDVNPLDLVETIREGILVLDPDLTIRFANRSFYDTFAVAPEHTVGRKLYEIGDGQWDIPELRSSLETVISGRTTLVSVACNGAHNLKQRLARWLLMMRDRGDDDVLQITQSLLAEMLGVQRPTITNAAHELERAGLIARGRRQVTILDRQGLTAASCECYQLVRMRVAVHLPKTYT